MRTRTTLVAVTLLASGVLVGWLAIGAIAQEKNPATRCESRSVLHRGRAGRAKKANASPRRRGRHLGHAGGQRRTDVPGDGAGQSRLQPGRLLVAAPQLEKPDADAESRHDLVFPFFNTKDVGPMVLEIPPAEEERVDHGQHRRRWQEALEDVGPAGADKGKGGKYLILRRATRRRPQTGTSSCRRKRTPASHPALQPQERQRRGHRQSGRLWQADQVLSAVAGGQSAPETKFLDAIDILFDSTIPYDLRFFQTLDRFVQREPWLERDKVMLDQLKTIGIEKGKPFNPDANTQRILSDAVRSACLAGLKYRGKLHAAVQCGQSVGAARCADVLEGMKTHFAKPDSYPVDGRGVGYSMGYFSPKHLGAGQFYLMTIVDKAGKPFDGGRTYRLNVPANPPVKLYWSATVYDRATHALIRDLPWSSRSSNTPGLPEERRRVGGHLLRS